MFFVSVSLLLKIIFQRLFIGFYNQLKDLNFFLVAKMITPNSVHTYK